MPSGSAIDDDAHARAAPAAATPRAGDDATGRRRTDAAGCQHRRSWRRDARMFEATIATISVMADQPAERGRRTSSIRRRSARAPRSARTRASGRSRTCCPARSIGARLQHLRSRLHRERRRHRRSRDVKCGVQLWDGLRVADDVFIGPNATFSNDKYPRSKQHQPACSQTHIGRGASIGAGAVDPAGTAHRRARDGRRRCGRDARRARARPSSPAIPARIVGYVDAKRRPAAPAADAARPRCRRP